MTIFLLERVIQRLVIISLVCYLLGVPFAEEKSVGPCTKLIFIGLELNPCDMIIRIPLHKVEVFREAIIINRFY
jgi:hypothetical protein